VQNVKVIFALATRKINPRKEKKKNQKIDLLIIPQFHLAT
jgi:hypothetical protein